MLQRLRISYRLVELGRLDVQMGTRSFMTQLYQEAMEVKHRRKRFALCDENIDLTILIL